MTQETKELNKVLEPVDIVRLIQIYNSGYGDYTKERQIEPDTDPDEAIARIREFKVQYQRRQ